MSHRPATLCCMFTLSIDAPAAGAARLRLSGHLDDAAAREVLHAAADVVQCGCSRLVVDLDGLVSWDDAASFAVVGCAGLARWLPEGVAVVAATSPGRDLADRAGIGSHPAVRDPAVRDPDIMAACPAS